MTTTTRAARKLYIVSRARPELHDRLSNYFAASEDTIVVLDRRSADRRAPDSSPGRRRHDVSDELTARGWALVESTLGDDPGAGATSARATLVIDGVSRRAQAALGGRSHVVAHFPFAVERCGDIGGDGLLLDTRLALTDREPFHISRRHCVIIRDGAGFAVVDTTSRLGTVVNGVRIGNGTGRFKARLEPGANDIAIGAKHTPYVFRLVVEHLD